MRPLLIVAIAYLLGSIPFGYLIVRLRQGADVRESGSGGTGATNVTRRAGKFAGVLTLILDAMKGAAAIWIAQFVVGPNVDSSWIVNAAAIAAILGHMFPVWLGFRGGKGVATAIGAFLVLEPLAVLLSGVVFVTIVWLTRYVSLGSIVAAAILPGLIYLLNYSATSTLIQTVTASTVCGVLIIFAHRANISRLIAGTESRFK